MGVRLMSVKQTARIISTYAGDTSGVASALFELGGMTVMHDASGCNSTYNTHDEPRWYDHDSLVFISALTEVEAMLGDDEKLIGDVVKAARELKPAFVAIAGTPIPMMTGVDFAAVARQIEDRTGIPSFGFDTNGMRSYVWGASAALAAVAERFVTVQDNQGTVQKGIPVNLLGLTPLDFSVLGADAAMKDLLEANGFSVLSRWAMGSSLDELKKSASAAVNLVVSGAGMGAAKVLKERFGTPYVVGTPVGDRYAEELFSLLRKSADDGECRVIGIGESDARRVVIGEGVTACSLARALTLESGVPTRAVSATDTDPLLTASGCPMAVDEDDLAPLLKNAETVIADPLYRPIVPKTARFVPLPHEGFSGRMFRRDIPDLIRDFNKFRKEFDL